MIVPQKEELNEPQGQSVGLQIGEKAETER